VKSNQAQYRISTLCRTLEVSASGYYAWSTRPPSARKISDMLLGDRIEANWRESRETYGGPRIQADLIDEGIHVSDKRVARLMKERNIHGASRRKGFKATVRDHDVDQLRTWLTAGSPPRHPTNFGWPTSPTFRRGAGSCLWRSCSTSTADASLVGQWQRICVPSWYSMR
jgi:transposase InsO family protein